MKRPLPPLPWLRAFEAAARHLSFTEAAHELGLTQAAISKHVKLLEQHLREPLFLRNPRSLTLTRMGAAYLPKVSEAFDRLHAGTREVFGARRGHVLTVRCAVGFAVNWLAPRLGRFRALHPDIEFRILSSVWNEAFDPALHDIDIRYGTKFPPGTGAHRLTWDTIAPLSHPGLVGRGENPQAALAANTLVHVLGYEEGWGVWLKAANITSIDAGSGLHVDTSPMAFEMAYHRLGIALGRSSLAQRDLQSGRLIKPFGLDVPIEEAFHALTPEAGLRHPDTGRFLDWLIGEADSARQENPLAGT